MGVKHNTGSGSWKDANIWDPTGVPSSITDALLDFGGLATVTLTGNGFANSAIIANQNFLALADGSLSAKRANVTNGGRLEAQSGDSFISNVVNQGRRRTWLE